MFGSRDRSVVKSSVMPSARYCWSGSLLRLAKGSTTIDRRGAARGCAIDVAAAIAGGVAGFVGGQYHHAPPAMSSAAMTATDATRAMLRRRIVIGKVVAGTAVTGLGRHA